VALPREPARAAWIADVRIGLGYTAVWKSTEAKTDSER